MKTSKLIITSLLCMSLLISCDGFRPPEYPSCIENFPVDGWQTAAYCHELTPAYSSTSYTDPKLEFFSVETGLLFNDQTLYKTTDEGESFNTIITDLPCRPVFVDFIDEQTGFCYVWDEDDECTDGAVYKTTDGGITWEFRSGDIVTTYNYPASFHFFDSMHGFAIVDDDYSDYAIYTRDGGITWAKTEEHNFRVYDLHIQITNDTTAYVTGQGVVFYKTTDSGMTWDSVVATGHSARFFQFISANEVFAIQIDGLLYHSMDGGHTWTQIDVPLCGNENNDAECDEITSMHFIDTQTGFLTGVGYYYDGGINVPYTITYSTFDGGATWTTNTIHSFKPRAMCFPDPDHGYVWDGMMNFIRISY